MSRLPDAESASISHVTDLLQVRSGKMCGKYSMVQKTIKYMNIEIM